MKYLKFSQIFHDFLSKFSKPYTENMFNYDHRDSDMQ